jgi:hypothetical protein
MPSIIIGNQRQLILQPDQTVSQAPDGSGEGRLSYKCPWAYVATYIPTPLQSHPLFPALLLYEFTTAREVGDIARFDLIYRGVLSDDPMALAQYETNKAVTAEPIETHPLFAYPPGSPPVTPAMLTAINLALQNNAPYTGSGSGGADVLLYKKKLRGIDSYYRVGTTFRKSYVSSYPPSDTSDVGLISDPDDSHAPGLSENQNWIQSGLSWRLAAGVCSIVEDYQASGLGQWDTDLYTRT